MIIDIKSSDKWSDDSWFKYQEDRVFIQNEGMYIINEGRAQGKIIGGNLCTLNLLQGTQYMPDLDNCILFIEDDDMAGTRFMLEFDRNLQSLLHVCKNNNIKGIVIGRAQKACQMTKDKWAKIINMKKELEGIPVIVNADFGHTTPIFTFPIGGTCTIKAINGKVELKIKG